MVEEKTRQKPEPAREKLEERYRKIGIRAIAAAVNGREQEKDSRQMTASMLPEWIKVTAQS